MKLDEKKIVVAWDLDETLGCFVEIGMLWDALNKFSSQKLTDSDFFKLLDAYPMFLRPDIMKILKLLKNKKKSNRNLMVIVFTNNQGPESWAEMIVKYFNHKLKYKLFDTIIPAYKVDGKQISTCRTSHEKKYEDLLACLKLPKGTSVCFIDDQEHNQMKKDDVHYILIKQYEISLPFGSMLERLKDSGLAKSFGVDSDVTMQRMQEFLEEYDMTVRLRSKRELDIDKIITKKLYSHIQTFLKDHIKKHNKTRRNVTRSFKKTFKIF